MYMICHMTTRKLILMYSIQFYYSIQFSSFELFRILVGALNNANHPEKGPGSIRNFLLYTNLRPLTSIQISAYTSLLLYESPPHPS